MNDTAIGKHLPDISQLGLNELLKLRATTLGAEGRVLLFTGENQCRT